MEQFERLVGLPGALAIKVVICFPFKVKKTVTEINGFNLQLSLQMQLSLQIPLETGGEKKHGVLGYEACLTAI